MQQPSTQSGWEDRFPLNLPSRRPGPASGREAGSNQAALFCWVRCLLRKR